MDGGDGSSPLHEAVSPAEALGSPTINAGQFVNLLVFRSESRAPLLLCLLGNALIVDLAANTSGRRSIHMTPVSRKVGQQVPENNYQRMGHLDGLKQIH